MICPRCDGKGQVLVDCYIYERSVGYENDIIEHEYPFEDLEPCPDCHGFGAIKLSEH